MIIGISGKIGSGKDTVGNIIQYLTRNKTLEEKGFKEFCEGYQSGSDWQVKKFAEKLKQIVVLLTGCNRKDLEDQDFKNKQLSREWDYYRHGTHLNPYPIDKEVAKIMGKDRLYSYTYREFLQKIGTEVMRDKIHQDIWINALFANYKAQIHRSEISVRVTGFIDSEIYPNWIITDTRFPNELQAIKDRNGINIRINSDFYKWKDKNGNNIITEEKSKELAKVLPVSLLTEHPSEIALDNAVFDYTIDNNGSIEELIEKVKEILIKEKLL